MTKKTATPTPLHVRPSIRHDPLGARVDDLTHQLRMRHDFNHSGTLMFCSDEVCDALARFESGGE